LHHNTKIYKKALRIFNFQQPKIRKGSNMKKEEKASNLVKKNRVFNGLTVSNPNSAGIDIGSRHHWVAVAPHLTTNNIRKYSTFTSDLNEICKWLKECKVGTVCMESTGVYWIPLFDLLEKSGFEVFLCNATQAKNLPGRQKTDNLDCAWIQKLHSYGLLTNSFIPDLTIRNFRSFMRHRENLIHDQSRYKLRMQKLLTQMNILLPKVLSNITGQTGMLIIKAIISGNTKPEQLLKFKHYGVKASDNTFLKALQGNYDKSLIKLLHIELKQFESTKALISNLDDEIELVLAEMLTPDSKKISSKTKLSDKEMLIAYTGVDLTEIPGVDVLSARKLICETGTDMSKWKDSAHFASWLRLSPHSKISGGKLQSSSTLNHKPRAAIIFRQCADTLKSNKSYLGDFLRRKKSQKNYGKALTATARKIAIIYYNMLKYKTPYVELGESFYSLSYKTRSIKRLDNYAKSLGYQIVKNDENIAVL